MLLRSRNIEQLDNRRQYQRCIGRSLMGMKPHQDPRTCFGYRHMSMCSNTLRSAEQRNPGNNHRLVVCSRTPCRRKRLVGNKQPGNSHQRWSRPKCPRPSCTESLGHTRSSCTGHYRQRSTGSMCTPLVTSSRHSRRSHPYG